MQMAGGWPSAAGSGDVDVWMPVPFTIVRRRREMAGTVTLWLEPAGRGGKAYTFRPGQFNMLYVFGVGEVPISVSGDPAQPVPVAHTVRSVGPVTRALVAMRPGEVVGLRGPFGTPWPVEVARGRDVVVVAGGIGLAPLRPLIHTLLRRRRDFGRVVVLYGARTPRELLYRRELRRWRGRLDVEVLVTVDWGDTSWRGHVGVVTALFVQAELFFDPANTVAYVCGPEVMMRFAARELLDRGVAAGRIYVSLERNMKCGQGHCGHCQYGPLFVCKDGPVFAFDRVADLMALREV